MDQTSTKPIRRFVHIGQSVASQVRKRADRWGLQESETIHQLIHLGLRASATGSPDEVRSDPRHEYLRVMLAEMLSVQVETLLYQREIAASASADPDGTNRTQKLRELDAKVRPLARAAAKQIRENVAKATADRAERTDGVKAP